MPLHAPRPPGEQTQHQLTSQHLLTATLHQLTATAVKTQVIAAPPTFLQPSGDPRSSVPSTLNNLSCITLITQQYNTLTHLCPTQHTYQGAGCRVPTCGYGCPMLLKCRTLCSLPIPPDSDLGLASSPKPPNHIPHCPTPKSLKPQLKPFTLPHPPKPPNPTLHCPVPKTPKPPKPSSVRLEPAPCSPPSPASRPRPRQAPWPSTWAATPMACRTTCT